MPPEVVLPAENADNNLIAVVNDMAEMIGTEAEEIVTAGGLIPMVWEMLDSRVKSTRLGGDNRARLGGDEGLVLVKRMVRSHKAATEAFASTDSELVLGHISEERFGDFIEFLASLGGQAIAEAIALVETGIAVLAPIDLGGENGTSWQEGASAADLADWAGPWCSGRRPCWRWRRGR